MAYRNADEFSERGSDPVISRKNLANFAPLIPENTTLEIDLKKRL